MAVSGPLTRPLRILAVGNMYPPHHAGGYEVMWQAAVDRARELGHSVRVLTSDYRASAEVAETDPDVHRTLRWYWDLENYRFPELSPLARLRLELHNARELRRHLHDFRPDVVSWWSMGAMSHSLIECVRRAGIPAAFIVHDDWLVYGPGFDQWIRMWRGKRRWLAPLVELGLRLPTSAQLTGRFVFNSRYTLDSARAAGVDVGRASVIPPGIETSLQRALGGKEWGWELLYLGRIDRQKGIDTAVTALAHLPEQATLAVWGTGQESYVQEIRELAEAHGVTDRVHFQGWAGPEERLAAYAAADVVVFPVRWQEPFGLVPLEAMSLGRPVVSTAQGGSAEYLEDGENALVFEPGDAAGLARAVQSLAEDRGLRDHLLEAGRRTAGHYTLERFAQDTVREILAVAAGRP